MAAARRPSGSAAPAAADKSLRVVSAPIDWVLPPAEVEAWMKRAQCGDRLRYGQGRQLVRGETSKLMRTLAASGDVHLFQPRSATGDGFDFLAVRNRVKIEVPPKPPRGQVGPVLDPVTNALFLKLKSVARTGERCPSDAALAKALGVTRNQIGWSLRKLVDLKLIDKRIEATPKDPKFRVVRIIDSGRETAVPCAKLTDSQQRAVQWLQDRGGDGCFTKHGQAMAKGEVAPFQRSTWNALQDMGQVKFYGGKRDGGSGHGRLRLAVPK